jgi:hypothetical protein
MFLNVSLDESDELNLKLYPLCFVPALEDLEIGEGGFDDELLQEVQVEQQHFLDRLDVGMRLTGDVVFVFMLE